jgi:hypothetical protein
MVHKLLQEGPIEKKIMRFCENAAKNSLLIPKKDDVEVMIFSYLISKSLIILIVHLFLLNFGQLLYC